MASDAGSRGSRSRSRGRSRDSRRSRSGSRRSGDSRRERSRGSGPREGERVKGEVIRWHPRGFGFIKPDDKGDDVFVHVSAITDGNALKEGDVVEYEVIFDSYRKKNRATNLTGGFREERRDFDRDRGYGGRGGDRYGGGGRYDDRRGRDYVGRGGDRYGGGGRYRSRSRDRYDDRRHGGGYRSRSRERY